MANTRKVMDVNEGGKHFAIIKHEGESSPYYLYKIEWIDHGSHVSESRKLIVKLVSIKSALTWIAGLY